LKPPKYLYFGGFFHRYQYGFQRILRKTLWSKIFYFK
jgi:hypothetical protein